MLREVERVGDGAGLLGAAVLTVELRGRDELLLRDAAHALHHLDRVAAVVPAQELEDRVRVPERQVTLRVALGVELVLPGLLVVGALLGIEPIEPREEPAPVRGRLELGVDQERGVRVVDDVVLEVEVVVDGVRDEAAEEGDVRARAQRHVHVGGGARPGEARVHVRVVEPPQLEEDAVDARDVPQVGLRLPEQLDRVVVARPELEAAAVPGLLSGGLGNGVVSHRGLHPP
ncbi:MAG: hypothetical protein HYU42_02040 [Candidatus Rokubacteria bacterium]|nr:hypothetical protein [Candidatus Rokubacteria bacterium]